MSLATTTIASIHKPARSGQSCGTCDAFLRNKAMPSAAGQPQQGWCRAAPPAMIQTVVPKPGGVLQGTGAPQMVPALQGVWPPTTSDGWCRAWGEIDDE